ncbi:MAG: DUF362 domain-containing protein [Dehalococcoidia bacterium]|jgi:hypothetical protein|nr:DUF362 domain-containing protein [Dehalococcoidia bacterium]
MMPVDIFEATAFEFRPPPQVARARRVLIKPDAAYPQPHPKSTSRETMEAIISGIRRVSDADILIVEGNPEGIPMGPTYQALGYSFPRVLTVDVKDSVCVEIETPLVKSFALGSAWVPNVLLSCDFWINVATCKVAGGEGQFAIHNLLGLLPHTKYRRQDLQALGMERVMADLYFILPFDMAIIDCRQRFTGDREGLGQVDDYGKVLLGESLEVDQEIAQDCGARTEYIELIRNARAELEV